MNDLGSRCGFVAIVGRPNVGKSTLLNHLMGQKLSITSSKPQTTRQQIGGISTKEGVQIIYVDTPGLHQGQKKILNRYMNKSVHRAIAQVDILVFLVDVRQWTSEDEAVLNALKTTKKPVVLVLNKIDLLPQKDALLPIMEEMQKKMDFKAMIPMAALTGENVKQLEDALVSLLPESVHFYPGDTVSHQNTHFFLAELVREKIMRLLQEEIPYATTVVIEKLEKTEKVMKVYAMIVVEREGQKGILIGKKGEMLKTIGRQARMDMESLLGQKVYLELWVKVKENWSDKDSLLHELGYSDPDKS